MSLLPEAGGETAVLDAMGTEQNNHRGSPPPALVCRIANFGVLAESVLKRDPHGPTCLIFKEINGYKKDINSQESISSNLQSTGSLTLASSFFVR